MKRHTQGDKQSSAMRKALLAKPAKTRSAPISTKKRKGKIETPPAKDKALVAHIDRPNFQQATFHIRGNAPFVQNRFSVKAQTMMIDRQTQGSVGNKGKRRDPKDFNALYLASMYEDKKGRRGIPAAAFRKAMISACRTVNFKMTLAKLGLFCVADSYDKDDGTPLVLFTKGRPEAFTAPTRNQTGVADIRSRGMWREGWECRVTLRWDADMFSPSDVANLLHRVGWQVGVGEGRADSKESAGMGWGSFDIVGH